MKKIVSIAVAVVMVMALAVSVFADTVWEYSSPSAVAIGWSTLFEKGSEEVAAFFEALKTEGAVLQLIGTDLTEADRTGDDGWFQLCTQDAASWTDGGSSKTEGIGETYEFTDEGYVMSVPTDAYNAILEACTVPTSDMQVVLNSGGSWTKTETNVVLRVVTGDGAVAAETEAEAPAAETPATETPTAESPAAEAPTTTEAPTAEAPTAEVPTAEAPQTGIALAVIPAIAALTAVVVSKKK